MEDLKILRKKFAGFEMTSSRQIELEHFKLVK